MRHDDFEEIMANMPNDSVPYYNGVECGQGCNCALIAMGGDEYAFDKIKKGYPCLKTIE